MPKQRRLVVVAEDGVPGRRQRQRQRAAGAARRDHRRPAAVSPGVVARRRQRHRCVRGALATIGVRVQSASLAADQSAAIASDAKTAVANASGVNLDEEAARLIQYQQSYQAAAKILQVAQTGVRLACCRSATDSTESLMRISTANSFDTGIDTLSRRQAEMNDAAGPDHDRQARQPRQRRPGRRGARRARDGQRRSQRRPASAPSTRARSLMTQTESYARRRRRRCCSTRASSLVTAGNAHLQRLRPQQHRQRAAIAARPAARRSPTRATAPAPICSAARARRRSPSSTRPSGVQYAADHRADADRERHRACRSPPTARRPG